MDAGAIVACACGACALLASLWKNSAHKKTTDDNSRDISTLQAKAAAEEKRVDKLTWQAEQTDHNIRDIKDTMHKQANKLQTIDGNLLLIKDWVEDQKKREDK